MAAKTINLPKLMRRAYNEGFMASGEGYNAEYPFNFDKISISRELSENRGMAIERILESVETE